MNASTTLVAGVGVAQGAAIITWLSTWPIHAPPNDVAMALAAIACAVGHAVWNLLSARFSTPKTGA